MGFKNVAALKGGVEAWKQAEAAAGTPKRIA
jgi:rhodanese-related sulfurtransferase